MHLHRWRVALMEKCVALLDFETVDQMVQIHGELSTLLWVQELTVVG